MQVAHGFMSRGKGSLVGYRDDCWPVEEVPAWVDGTWATVRTMVDSSGERECRRSMAALSVAGRIDRNGSGRMVAS